MSTFGLDTSEGIIPVADILTALREDLRSNIDRFTADWHRDLQIGDTVIYVDPTDEDPDPVINGGKVADPYADGFVELDVDGAVTPLPAATILAPVSAGSAIPKTVADLVSRVRSNRDIIVSKIGATYAYRPQQQAGGIRDG